MKTFYFCLLIFLSAQCSLAQISFQKTYGSPDTAEYGISVIQSPDEGYILLNTPFSLMKVDPDGNELWKKIYPGENAASMALTGDGGYILSGAKNYDSLMLLKTDDAGNEIWSESYPAVSDSFYRLEPGVVKQTTDGGFVIAGSAESGSILQLHSYLLETNETGDELWRIIYPDPVNGNTTANDMLEVNDGYLLFGTYCSGNIALGSFYLFKTDFDGNILWSKTYESSSYYDEGKSFAMTSDGGFILAGIVNNPLSMWQSLMIKTDANGNEQWRKLFGDDAQKWAYAVRVTADGGYIFCGSSLTIPNNMWIYQTNIDGVLSWEKTFDLELYTDGSNIIQTSDEGFAAIGSAYQDPNFDGDRDIALVKIAGFVGIDNADYASSDITISPNPFSDYTSINLSHGNSKNLSVHITDLAGHIMRIIDHVPGNNFSIAAGQLSPGTYLLAVYNQQQLVEVSKLVVQ